MDDSPLGVAGRVIRLRVGQKRSGEPVFENVLVEVVEGGHMKLLHSPGLALGVASGDVIEVNSADSVYKVISRGGNIAVQVYGPPAVALSIEPQLRQMGGWHDGGVKNVTIFTIPAHVGFDAIESVLNSLAAQSDIEWYYGNVYGDDGTDTT